MAASVLQQRHHVGRLDTRLHDSCSFGRQLRAPFTVRQRHHIGFAQRQRCAAAAADSLQLFSPSKINLFLRVVRRREDGYHDLASLFHVIDLGDTMDFSIVAGDSDHLTCTDPSIPTNDSNLVIKALNLFRAKTGMKQCFSVHLDKKVPHGAGLGGGSGNAATTLWAANELTGRPATTEQLLEWSGDIGSDISVFFAEGAAYCTGRCTVASSKGANCDIALFWQLLRVVVMHLGQRIESSWGM